MPDETVASNPNAEPQQEAAPPDSNATATPEGTVVQSGQPHFVQHAPQTTAKQVPGFDLIEELGRGGMGVVYKAKQRGLDRLVALKMVLHGTHATPQDIQRFRAEAEAIARLRHPNIVEVYAFGESADGLPYFALEFCEGG